MSVGGKPVRDGTFVSALPILHQPPGEGLAGENKSQVSQRSKMSVCSLGWTTAAVTMTTKCTGNNNNNLMNKQNKKTA